jgi:RNA polymerase sigma factor (sigma-70 family)
VDSLQHYLRLAARIIRHTLFDLARAGRVRNHLSIDQMMMRASDGVAHYQAVANTGNPDDRIQRIEAFEELQQTIENLPDDERNVVDLHLVQGLSQADIAAMLQEHPKKISRLWRSAKCKLPEWLF